MPTDRIPTMPQLCQDTPIRIYHEDCGDWIDRTARCLEVPSTAHEYVIRLAKQIHCDGLRLFVLPDPMEVRRVGDDLFGVSPSGERMGRVDLFGGGQLVPDRPHSPMRNWSSFDLPEIVFRKSSSRPVRAGSR
ncbi:MAG: hypothetical protein V1800_09805 [Candidatus Latescibacterota bacterium]